MKVIDNLYAYLWPGLTMTELMASGNNSNSYLISNCVLAKGKSKHLLVDPGQIVNETGTQCLQRLLEGMREDGLNPEDVGMVVNTHCHQDHCQASKVFQQDYGAVIAIGEKEEALMANRMPDLKPDLLLKEGELKLDSIVLQVINTPGHSPGSISLYWKEKKALIAGDVVFQGNTGRVDITGGSGARLRETITRLGALDIEYLLTGHQYEAPGIIKGAREVRRNFEFIMKNVFPYL